MHNPHFCIDYLRLNNLQTIENKVCVFDLDVSRKNEGMYGKIELK